MSYAAQLVTDLSAPGEDGAYQSLHSIWAKLKAERRKHRSLRLDIEQLFGEICEAQGRPPPPRFAPAPTLPIPIPPPRSRPPAPPPATLPFLAQEEPDYVQPAYGTSLFGPSILHGTPGAGAGVPFGPLMGSQGLNRVKPKWRPFLDFVKGYKRKPKQAKEEDIVVELMELHAPAGQASTDTGSEQNGEDAWVQYKIERERTSSKGVTLGVWGSSSGGGKSLAIGSGTETQELKACARMYTNIRVRIDTYQHRWNPLKRKKVVEPVKVNRKMYMEDLATTEDRCRKWAAGDEHTIEARLHPYARGWMTSEQHGGIRRVKAWNELTASTYWTVSVGGSFSQVSLNVHFEDTRECRQLFTWQFPDSVAHYAVLDTEESGPRGILPYFVRKTLRGDEQREEVPKASLARGGDDQTG